MEPLEHNDTIVKRIQTCPRKLDAADCCLSYSTLCVLTDMGVEMQPPAIWTTLTDTHATEDNKVML